MMKNQHHDRSIQSTVAEGKTIKLCFDELDVAMIRESMPGRFEHCRLTIDREDARHHRGKAFCRIATSAPEISYHPFCGEKTKKCFLGESETEEFTTYRLPLGSDSSEERTAV